MLSEDNSELNQQIYRLSDAEKMNTELKRDAEQNEIMVNMKEQEIQQLRFSLRNITTSKDKEIQALRDEVQQLK